MAAYVIVNIEVKDPEGYKEYGKLSRPAAEKYGGKFIVRGGQVDVKEGTFVPKRFVIIEFESMEKAQGYYNSPEYAEARAIRQKYAVTDYFIVEGV